TVCLGTPWIAFKPGGDTARSVTSRRRTICVGSCTSQVMSAAEHRDRSAAMSIQVNTAQPEKRIVPKDEEIRRKQAGSWDPRTMISTTSPEGAALRAAMAKAGEPMQAP